MPAHRDLHRANLGAFNAHLIAGHDLANGSGIGNVVDHMPADHAQSIVVVPAEFHAIPLVNAPSKSAITVPFKGKTTGLNVEWASGTL